MRLLSIVLSMLMVLTLVGLAKADGNKATAKLSMSAKMPATALGKAPKMEGEILKIFNKRGKVRLELMLSTQQTPSTIYITQATQYTVDGSPAPEGFKLRVGQWIEFTGAPAPSLINVVTKR